MTFESRLQVSYHRVGLALVQPAQDGRCQTGKKGNRKLVVVDLQTRLRPILTLPNSPPERAGNARFIPHKLVSVLHHLDSLGMSVKADAC